VIQGNGGAARAAMIAHGKTTALFIAAGLLDTGYYLSVLSTGPDRSLLVMQSV
jgi:hypothetical protein